VIDALTTPEDLPELAVPTSDGERRVRYRGESELRPERLEIVDDQTRAEDALKAMREGTWLVYRGHEAGLRQLYSALSRRVETKKRRQAGLAPSELFHRERAARQDRHRVLSRLCVELDADYALRLERAGDVREACRAAWGASDQPLLVSYRLLLGATGAYEWQRRGVPIRALGGRVFPRYGVFSPSRPSYVELVAEAPPPAGLCVFDIGTGTGVLGLLAAKTGASVVLGTDVDPRAVACARDNVERFSLSATVRVVQADLYPEGRADRLLFNPPWLPGKPRTLLDRSVFDPGSALLERYLAGAREHLTPGGEVWLVLGDLAERLGLRAETEVEERARRHGLALAWTRSKAAGALQGKPDEHDPLDALRREEQVLLRCFVPA
jgi:methylase of polypeptide subunit release factors